MHKMVDGKRIELTQKEIDEVMLDRERAITKAKERKEKQRLKNLDEIESLRNSGLTEEAIKCLKPELYL